VQTLDAGSKRALRDPADAAVLGRLKQLVSFRAIRNAAAGESGHRTAFRAIETLLDERRFEAAKDAASALFERWPTPNSLQAYLHTLACLGDDRTSGDLLRRPDVAALVARADDPYLRLAWANEEARRRLAAAFPASEETAVPEANFLQAGATARLPASRRRGTGDGPRRIGYFLHSARPFASGGYAIRSHEIARAMAGAGYVPTVFARSGFPRDLGPDAASLDISPRTLDGVPYVYSESPSKDGFLYRYIEESARHYEALIERHALDIVHAASNHLVALPAALAARRRGLPFVYEVRSFWEMTRASWDPGYARRPEARRDDRLEQLCLDMAATVLTLNPPMADRLASRGVDREQLFVLPNCVDIARLAPRPRDQALASRLGIAPGDVVVGYVGTFVPYEGLDLLIRAFGEVRAREPSARLLLVGDDRPLQVAMREPTGDRLRKLAADTGLGHDIIFTGRVPVAEVADYYSLIDICPFPRRRDEVCQTISPLKPLEALAMEKCVLVSDVGGMRDLVADGVTGLKFESENVEALTARLLEAVQRKDLRRALSVAGRRWVLDHRTWGSLHQPLRQAYRHAWRAADANDGSRHGAEIAR
jgi:glycosyltransferase involved in cell wall biosynthesis